jgi:hypothetical protein
MQVCPYCQEEVKKEAKKCKHCGEILDVALRAAEEAKKSSGGNVFNVAGGSSSSSSSSSDGNFLNKITCLDWGLIFLTGGLWLIVVTMRGR